MEPTNIILIVIFAICGLVLVWAIKNGNNIKLKKKEKKQKADKKEKFKEVIPKEKPEKAEKPEKKQKKETIKDSAKAEKAGKAEPPTNKVMKVTKEDFKSNDMEVPKALGGEEKKTSETKKNDFKFDADNFELPPLKNFGKDDFNFDDNFLKDDITGLDPAFEDFLAPMKGSGETGKDLPFLPAVEEDSFDFSSDEFMSDLDSLLEVKSEDTPKSSVKGEILNETVEQRISKVFGDTLRTEAGVKEVMVGEVLAGNRSRTNRELREKRKKWMK